MSKEALLSDQERLAYYEKGKRTPFVSSLGAIPLALFDFPFFDKIRSKTIERLQMRSLGAGRLEEISPETRGKFFKSSYIILKNRTREARSFLGFAVGGAGTVLGGVGAVGAFL